MKDPQQANSNFGEKISNWLSFNGRINQQDFWLFHVLPFVLLYLLPIPFISLFSIWILLAGLAKRFHDSDASFKKKLLPFSVVGIVGIVVLAIVLVILFIFTLMGAMTGSISPNDFSDGFENVFQIILFGIPFLALVIIAIYAGLKPSSPDENKYGSPTPTQSVISKKNKTRIRRGILIFIVVFLSLLVGFVAIRMVQNRKEPGPQNAELISAIKDGKSVGEIRTLLENGEDPNIRINRKTTPIVWAMYHHPNPTEIVSLLLQYGANPDVPSEIEWGHNTSTEASTLKIAAQGGNTEIIETLLKNGVDPNAIGNNFILIATLESNQIEISRLLVAYGADLNFYANDEALLTVVQNRSIEGVTLLLNNGISAEQIEAAKKWITAELGVIDPKTKDYTTLVEIQGLLINAQKSNGK